MRVVAFAFAAVSLAALMENAAVAQGYGPGPYADDPRSGPPRSSYTERPRQDAEQPPPYFTDRPPPRRPGEGFQQPAPYRGAPPDRERRYDRAGDDRPGVQPRPERLDAGPPPVRRRVEQEPPPPAPRAGDRGTRTTVWPAVRVPDGAPPRRAAERPPARPHVRTTDRATVSIGEFRELENRVRELERLLADRPEFRADRRRPDRPPTIIYR